MKRTTYLMILFSVIGGCIACSSEAPTVQSSKTLTDDFVQNHKTKASELHKANCSPRWEKQHNKPSSKGWTWIIILPKIS